MLQDIPIGSKVTLAHKTQKRILTGTFLGHVPGTVRYKFEILLGGAIPSVVLYSKRMLEDYDIVVVNETKSSS